MPTYEQILARRIANERERRGLSYEKLAEAMTDAGCPTNGSAIYKIEKGQPPRRITVNELAALSFVFDTPSRDLMSSEEPHPPTPRTATHEVDIQLGQLTLDIRDQVTTLADILTKASDALSVASAELYRAAAPDTDVADEEAVTERTIAALHASHEYRKLPDCAKQVVDDIAAQGVDIGVVEL